MKTALLLVCVSFSALAQEPDLSKLKRTYKTQLVTGSIELASGATLIGLGFYLKNKLFTTSVGGINQVQVTEEGHYKTQSAISFVCGGLFTGIGIYSIVKGAKNRKKYINLSGSPSSVTLNITF